MEDHQEIKVEGLDRNLRLYPIYDFLFSACFWAPIFFLYFSERVDLPQVLQLQALYYISVVLLEVPSGYFSDQVGRKLTLIIAAAGLGCANGLFYLGTDFIQLAVAQTFLAIGYSFYSGTSHSFHYDSLVVLGRESEFRDREAKVASRRLIGGALSAAIGGVVASYALKNGFGLTAITAFGALGVALFFTEPSEKGEFEERTPFLRQAMECLGYLKEPKLLWMFFFMVLFTVVVHVPPEFFQSYVDLLELSSFFTAIKVPTETPLVTGLTLALSSLFAAGLAAKSSLIAQRWGARNVFLFAVLIQVLIAGAMAVFLHPGVLFLLLLRKVPDGLVRAPYVAEVSPLIDTRHRATFFSLNSLAGRLSYSALLFFLSVSGGASKEMNLEVLQGVLLSCVLVGGTGFLILFSTRSVTNRAMKNPSATNG